MPQSALDLSSHLVTHRSEPVYFTGGHDYTEPDRRRHARLHRTRLFFAQIDAWLADPAGSRVFFLGGGPGSEKSATASPLAPQSVSEGV